MRILVVEDERDVADAVGASLARRGIVADHAATAADARGFLDVQDYDAIVLDIHLPDGDGRAILSELRQSGRTVPVLMLTAEYAIASRVDALDAGADDYLVKPFDLAELEARLRVLDRRNRGDATEETALGDLVFDRASRTVRVAGRPVALSRREVSLLGLLLAQRGRIVAKERILDHLFAMDEDVGLNAVELYVARLRKKLAESSVAITTHRGLGYRLDDG